MRFDFAVNLENVAVNSCIFILADCQLLFCRAFLFNLNPPNSKSVFGIANTNNCAVKKTDAHILVVAPNFILFVLAALDLYKVIACTINFYHICLHLSTPVKRCYPFYLQFSIRCLAIRKYLSSNSMPMNFLLFSTAIFPVVPLPIKQSKSTSPSLLQETT